MKTINSSSYIMLTNSVITNALYVSGQKNKLIETLLVQRRKYCMEHGTAFVMNSPRTSTGIMEETTFITDNPTELGG